MAALPIPDLRLRPRHRVGILGGTPIPEQNRIMKGTLVIDGVTSDASIDSVTQTMAAGTPFWLDLDGLDDESTHLLADTLHIHPLALEDAEHFGQRPKIDEFDDFTYFVVHGAMPNSFATSELHIFLLAHSIVTVHHGECPALVDVLARVGRQHHIADVSPQVSLVYKIVDSLIDTFFPVLSTFDDRIDELEDDILRKPTEAQLGILFDMKRSLINLRKVITPQRDMFAALASGVVELPSMNEEGQRYFRDIYDHCIRIADVTDGYRDLLSGVMDTHVSTVSNRLNVVMKQLTIIATIFLPLSFLTGFFGQNFSYLVSNIQGPVPFFIFGLAIELATVIGLVYFFRRRGWIGGPTA
jgi:magnesium transporter